MDIPLLNIEDVEKEGEDMEISIRNDIIEFLENKGYKYTPAEKESDETHDFFIKDNQLIQVIINDEMPEEVLEQIAKEWRIKERIKIKDNTKIHEE